jgi:hypothetical protein
MPASIGEMDEAPTGHDRVNGEADSFIELSPNGMDRASIQRLKA